MVKRKVVGLLKYALIMAAVKFLGLVVKIIKLFRRSNDF
jgi:hypothetical protein